MSIMTTLGQSKEVLDFAEQAAQAFADNPRIATFSRTVPVPGDLLALRWGLGNDCVLVVRLDYNFQPINFQQAVLHIASHPHD